MAVQERSWKVPTHHEIRIESGETEIVIVLLHGVADIFGTPLANHREYKLWRQTVAVFARSDDCDLLVCGVPESIYVSQPDKTRLQIMKCYAVLQQRRDSSTPDDGEPPRVMVCGARHCGKSTACRLLLNFATAEEKKTTTANCAPIVLVDLNVDTNAITIPGAIAATPVTQLWDAAEPRSLTTKVPLAFFYGRTNSTASPKLYLELCGRMANSVLKRCGNAALVIDVCSYVNKRSLDTLIAIAKQFRVNHFIVVGEERLGHLLRERFLDLPISFIDKSAGIASPNREQQTYMRSELLHEYFYGGRKTTFLCCHTFERSFDQTQVFRVTEADGPTPTSVLPLGTTSLLAKTTEPHLEAQNLHHTNLEHAILAVSVLSPPEMTASSVIGFALVTEHNAEKQTITLLVPSFDIPKNARFLLGDIRMQT